jgi:adenylate cyclase
MERRLAAIFAADVVGYSHLVEADEEATLRRLKAYREIIGQMVAEHRGRVFGSAGDSVVAEFASPVEAVRCAVDIQREIEQRNADLPADQRMQFRIGINLGDVVVEGDDLLGDGINVAARLEGEADAGGICISEGTYAQVKKTLDLGYEFLGKHKVKNIEEPVPVYRVHMDAGAVPRISRAKRRQWQRAGLAAVVVVAVAVIAVAAWDLYLRPAPPPAEVASGETPALELPDKPSIAVLPFDNLSGDPEQEYLSDGITESLITRLARQPDMFVIARNSSFTYKDKVVKAQEVGRELGVRYVLEGSVQKAGERLRITAQLIKAATGNHLWADSYDRELQDVFALQDEITQKVAVEIRVKLTAGEVARSEFQATGNFEAYDYWLRGVQAYRRFKKETNVRAGELFEKAIELDPQYARAIGYLGWVRLNESRFGWVEDRDRSFKLAKELARRAIATDENSSVGHSLLGRIFSLERQYEDAIAEGKRTVAIEPGSAGAYASLARTMAFAGRPEEGLVLIRKALRLSPYPPVWYHGVECNINYLTGRYEASIASGRKVLERTQEGSLARGAWWRLIASYMELGREAEARAAAEIYLQKDPDFSVDEHAEWLRGSVYKDQSWQDRYIEALRKAGLPE